MNRRIIYVALSLLVDFVMVMPVLSQCRITGQVRDDKGRPLGFASIYIENTIDGATADSLGRYTFKTSAKGKQVLVATFVSYETTRDTILIDKKSITHDFMVKEKTIAMLDVVITAGSYEANDEQKVAVLKPLDIYTNAGAGGDIMGAIRTLPGAQPQSDQTGLFVRGGDASESLVIIDGMVVQNPFSSNVPGVSQRSRFTPFQFKGLSFSSGGYSVRYGQALSSVLELNTTDLPSGSTFNFSLGLTGLQASGIKKWNSSAIELTGSYDNLTPFLKLANTNFKYFRIPESGGGSVKYTWLGSKKDLLKVFLKYDKSNSGIYIPNPFVVDSIIPYHIKNENLYFNSSYNHYFNKLVLRTSISASTNNDHIGWGATPGANRDWRVEWRGEALYVVTERFKWLGGIELQRYRFSQSYDTLSSNFNEFLSAGYLEAEWKPAPRFTIKPGLRVEHSTLLNKSSLGPRIALAFGTGQYSQISLAWGMFYQDPDKNYLLAGYRPGFQMAVHYIGNFQWIKDDRTFRIETYYKSYSDLVRELLVGTYNPNPYRFIRGPVDNSGNGYAGGLEIFWRDKKTIRNFDYWVSYSYIDTKRLYENYVAKAVPGFVSNNNLNILAKYFVEPWQLNIGLAYTYASGRPYYNPASPVFLGDRTPDYQSLAANMSYLITIGKFFAVAYISVDNLTGRKNIYGYNYSFDGQQRYPIVPALYRYVYAGFTVSLTKFNQDEL
jgi:hypothetical protein